MAGPERGIEINLLGSRSLCPCRRDVNHFNGATDNSWPIINLFLIIQFSLLFIILNAEKRGALQIFFYVTIIFSLLNYCYPDAKDV